MSESTVAGAGRRMKYPYTILGKFVNFPWKHYWKHGRGFRFIIYSIPISLLVISPINKFVNSPSNVAEWDRIRKARQHDIFAPPTDHPGHH